MSASPVLGRFLWYELMTTDLTAALAFYKTVVGWNTAPFEGSPTPYQVWMRGQTPIGGAMTLPDELKQHGVPPHWTMYVGVPKLEEAAAQIERLGGGALSPVIEVPTVGRMQTMRDPQGGAFSIYEPAGPPQAPEAPPEVGDASWHELYTTDAPAAMKFYGEIFGWKPTESMDMGPMGTYHMFGRHLGSLGGMMNKTPDMAQMPTAWLVYFRVPDVHAAADRIKANGGTVVHTMEVPGGDWIAQAIDPQGAAFAVHHKKPA